MPDMYDKLGDLLNEALETDTNSFDSAFISMSCSLQIAHLSLLFKILFVFYYIKNET